MNKQRITRFDCFPFERISFQHTLLLQINSIFQFKNTRKKLIKIYSFHKFSHPKMNYKNHTTTIQISASINYVSRHHYNAYMYPIGLNNTIVQRKKPTKVAVAMYPAVSQKNEMPTHNDGLALIQKQHRSVHLDPIDPIVVHYY